MVISAGTSTVPAATTVRKNAFLSNEAAWRVNVRLVKASDGSESAQSHEHVHRNDADYVSQEDGDRPDWWWTGRAPSQGCPGMLADGTITSLPLPNLATVTREQALDYFDNTWTITEVLFSALQGALDVITPLLSNPVRRRGSILSTTIPQPAPPLYLLLRAPGCTLHQQGEW